MQLERLTVSARPRSGWESLDLGFQMARQWWRQTWGVWLMLYVPAATVALMVFSNKFYAALALWWLKPLFDRAVLYGLSRLVFGEQTGVVAVLRNAGDWLRPGLFFALTLRRFEWARAFQLPVTALEKQDGESARQRRAVLGSRLRGTGVWLTVVCIHFEMIAMFSLFALGRMLIPSAGDIPGYGEGSGVGDVGLFDLGQWGLTEAICYAVGVSLIEPFYVAAGFSLYLNRRTILEGWDMEIRLRQISNRLKSLAASTLIALCIANLAASADGTAYAADTPAPKAAEEIAQVLADPEFAQHRDITRWRALEPRKPDVEEPSRFSQFWQNLALLLADISQALLWIAMAALAVILFFALRRYVPQTRHRKARSETPEANLFGLNIAPESLPGDISATAARLVREGQSREALSLLYRGALSALVHRHRLTIHDGTTEDECARSATFALDEAGAGYFRTLVMTWQQLAYGETSPERVQLTDLCRGWDAYFGTPDSRAAERRT